MYIFGVQGWECVQLRGMRVGGVYSLGLRVRVGGVYSLGLRVRVGGVYSLAVGSRSVLSGSIRDADPRPSEYPPAWFWVEG